MDKLPDNKMRRLTMAECECAVSLGETVFTLNPQRGWVPCSENTLRRGFEWHKKPENARMVWRGDLYAVFRSVYRKKIQPAMFKH